MNCASPNSPGFAAAFSPPSPPLFLIEDEAGSCSPATSDKLAIAMKQQRTAETKRKRLERDEIAMRVKCNLEDSAACRELMKELAEADCMSRKNSARLQVMVKIGKPKKKPDNDLIRRSYQVSKERPSPGQESSWYLDDQGRRGVHFNLTYLGRKSKDFAPGEASAHYRYVVRDDAVLLDERGRRIVLSNVADSTEEGELFWDAMEKVSTGKAAKIQVRIIVAFDADMSTAEKLEALHIFCKTVLAPLGLPYFAAMHQAPGDARNVHAHILTSFRPATRVEEGCWDFSRSVRGELDGPDGVQMMRHLWAHSMSEASADQVYTGLSYAARGLPYEAGEHLGAHLSAALKRGEAVAADERNKKINACNQVRQCLRDVDKKIAALSRQLETVQLARTVEAATQRQSPAVIRRSPSRKPSAAPIYRTTSPRPPVTPLRQPARSAPPPGILRVLSVASVGSVARHPAQTPKPTQESRMVARQLAQAEPPRAPAIPPSSTFQPRTAAVLQVPSRPAWLAEWLDARAKVAAVQRNQPSAPKANNPVALAGLEPKLQEASEHADVHGEGRAGEIGRSVGDNTLDDGTASPALTRVSPLPLATLATKETGDEKAPTQLRQREPQTEPRPASKAEPLHEDTSRSTQPKPVAASDGRQFAPAKPPALSPLLDTPNATSPSSTLRVAVPSQSPVDASASVKSFNGCLGLPAKTNPTQVTVKEKSDVQPANQEAKTNESVSTSQSPHQVNQKTEVAQPVSQTATDRKEALSIVASKRDIQQAQRLILLNSVIFRGRLFKASGRINEQALTAQESFAMNLLTWVGLDQEIRAKVQAKEKKLRMEEQRTQAEKQQKLSVRQAEEDASVQATTLGKLRGRPLVSSGKSQALTANPPTPPHITPMHQPTSDAAPPRSREAASEQLANPSLATMKPDGARPITPFKPEKQLHARPTMPRQPHADLELAPPPSTPKPQVTAPPISHPSEMVPVTHDEEEWKAARLFKERQRQERIEAEQHRVAEESARKKRAVEAKKQVAEEARQAKRVQVKGVHELIDQWIKAVQGKLPADKRERVALRVVNDAEARMLLDEFVRPDLAVRIRADAKKGQDSARAGLGRPPEPRGWSR